MADLPTITDLARAIPDRQGVTDSAAKRVLDALAESVGQVAKWVKNLADRVAALEAVKIKEEVTAVEEEEEEATEPIEVPRYDGKFSVALLEGKFQLVNDEDPAASKVYCTNAAGERGWLSSVDFINEVLGDSLNTYIQNAIAAYVTSNFQTIYVNIGNTYSEGTMQFGQVLRQVRVAQVVGDPVPSVVFTAEECPE